MAYDWEGAATQSGEKKDENIPAGTECDAEIAKVLHANRDGEPYVSKSGDPQFLIIWHDAQGRSALDTMTCTEKAGWKIAKICSHCGVDLQALNADGIEPARFADNAFAVDTLQGRMARIKVTQNGKYSNVETLGPPEEYEVVKPQPRDMAADAVSKDDIPDDDIPF